MNIVSTTPADKLPEATKPLAPVVYCFSADNVMSALAMASSALACKNRCLKAALEDSAKLAACNAHLLQQTGELKAKLDEERLLADEAMQNLRGRVEVLEQQWATAQQQLADQAQNIRQKDEEYAAKVNMLEQVDSRGYYFAGTMCSQLEWLSNPCCYQSGFQRLDTAKAVCLMGQFHIFGPTVSPPREGFCYCVVSAGCGLP
jgi:hypothetical protein